MASRDQQWYDTRATSHLSSHTGNLHTSSLNRNFHSIIVENGSIPVTHSGHVQIPNSYRPLHLRNVLVTPNIIKNLVSVRKFTTNNKCSIDFDPYGFTVRDYHTRQTLLRCNSMGDLYPLHVAASAFALLTNNHSLWHQRLDHLGDASKLLHFRAFVKTQFNSKIKAFQCDHGGEFDNNSLYYIFATNGIQFLFSCPRTSQQNGKSEHMIHTINNVVRSLLFQARLPPEYWVKALLTTAYLLNILPLPLSIMTSLTQNYLTNHPLTPTYARLDAFVTLTPFHRTTTPPPPPPPTSQHPMVTCSKVGIVKANPKYNLHVTTSSPIPNSPFHDLRDPNWKQAMCDEYKALIDNNTWVLVPRLPNVNIVCSMWLYKHKYNADGSLNWYKARLVANGRSQQQGINYDETFRPVVKPATIRTVLSLAVSRQWPIHYFFYFTPATYHLFTKCGICYDRPWPTQLFSRTPIDTEKKLGPEGSPVTDPTLNHSLAGSLQYLTFTRPDLSYAVQQLCLYMHDHREPHLNAMKRVLCYLQGTTDLGLQLFRSITSQLIAYSDADWAGCPATRRSTSGYCVFLGYNLLTWSSKRQDTLSRSSVEAEYREVANVVAETSWIRNLLCELHTPLFTTTLVYCDNVSAVYMSANPVQHQRNKHIEIDIHFVRDKVAAGHVFRIRSPRLVGMGGLLRAYGVRASGSVDCGQGVGLVHAERAAGHRRVTPIIRQREEEEGKKLELAFGPDGIVGSGVGSIVKVNSVGCGNPSDVIDGFNSMHYRGFSNLGCRTHRELLSLHAIGPRETRFEPPFNVWKCILCYLRGTTDLGLQLFQSTTSQLIAYSDADWAGCPATRRSTSGYCIFLGDNLLTWSSKRQDMLSRSNAEAEYRGVTNAVAETSWIRNLLRELHTPLFTATLVYCDNVSVVYMSANPVQHQRNKHIEIDIHFVRDKVAAGHV
ncbi:ribonuclease H-like domain-containing protein [Tanacetum coccineum]|uniref:Ribonuclease H-like domain-containing protein n=1 Tax=Tanacetum coccineum TaxID=301880 RepID=A0ABQ5E9G2_9ASTR